ncbi:MAG: S1C family serine protease, partial [Candidatus Binatia bacterium]
MTVRSSRRFGVLAAATVLCVTGAAAASLEDAVDRLMASSVCILGDVPGGKFEASGFVVAPGTQVLTTAHEIVSATNFRIKLNDGRVFPARLERVGSERADIALLGLVGTKLEPATLGSVDGVRAGDAVRTVGCPSGFDFTLSQGVVSSVRASDLGYPLIQTDVAVNPG